MPSIGARGLGRIVVATFPSGTRHVRRVFEFSASQRRTSDSRRCGDPASHHDGAGVGSGGALSSAKNAKAE